MLDSDRAASRRGQPLDAPLNCGPTGHARRMVMATASVVPSGGTLLLEREAQVAALEAVAGAARGGDGRFVVIEGSVGIGKTRLLAEARTIAGSAGERGAGRRGGGGGGGGPVVDWQEVGRSRCSNPPIRISVRSCSRGLPRSSNRS